MANTIRVKRRVSGSSGAPASLKTAELAWNMADNTLYGGYGDDGSGNATSVVALGGTGTFAVLASPAFTGTPTAPTAAANTNTTQIATTAFVLGQANSTAGTIAMNGTQAAGTSNLYARADHVHPTDTSRAPLASPTFTGTPAAPTAAVDTNTTQLATTAFVLAQAASATPAALGVAAVGTSTRYARADHVHAMPVLSALGTPTADVAMGTFKITGLGDPVSAQDAATKNYVDSVAQGLDAKASVKAATTANITLSGTQTIDGVAVVASDRVLVKNQSTTSANGVYVVAAGAWTRATDMDTWAEVPNAFVFVEQGTANADTGWVCTADQGGTLNTTAITWVQFSAAGSYTAGNGLQLSSSVFSVLANGTTIDVSASGIKVSDTYPGNTSLVTLGTVTTGTWNATAIGAAYGGTGQTTYAVGDILYASGATALSKLAAVATGNVLISGGVTTAPSWGKVGLTTHVSGTLPVANGGTGVTTSTGSGAVVLGTSPTITTPVITFSTSNTVTAGTNAQGQGALTSDLNVITTATANPSGVTLPTATQGRHVKIINKGANPINVYPATGAAIDGLAANASIQIPVGGELLFWASSTTQWYSGVNALQNVSIVTGTLAVANGGTGATTLTGLVKGNGTSAFTAAVAGTDYHDTNSTIDGGTF